jgi:hypothetical protein
VVSHLAVSDRALGAEQIGNNIQLVATLMRSKHAAGSIATPTIGELVWFLRQIFTYQEIRSSLQGGMDFY